MDHKIKQLLPDVFHRFYNASLVGSYECCDPIPENADIDILFLLDSENVFEFIDLVLQQGFIIDSNYHITMLDFIFEHKGFVSWKKKDCLMNLLITLDIDFYERFNLATAVCKRLNVQDKKHRKIIHAAILYKKFLDI